MDTQELQQDLAVESISEADLKVVQEMMKAGLMYGHKKSKTNPRFKPYIFFVLSRLNLDNKEPR